jgi:two-component system response regulator AtoC
MNSAPLVTDSNNGLSPYGVVTREGGRASSEKDDVRASASRERRWVRLVIGDQTKATYPLPDNGTVTIGRAQGNDVMVDDPAISRRHAILHLGPTIRVEDLGSANGTRVCDAKVFGPRPAEMLKTAEILDRKVPSGGSCEIHPGNVIQVGSTMLVVQHGAATARPRRLWPHGYFEGCLEEECARAERADAHKGTPRAAFAVMRIHVDEGTPQRAVEEVLSIATRSVDVVAAYGPGEYEVLVIDADPASLGKVVDEVKRRIIGFLSERGAHARVGTACWPSDGRSPETLLAKACQRVESADGADASPLVAAVIVQDPAMQRLYRMAERIADSTISVLLLGETGVGKEVLAETLHRLSSRANKPFVRLNCAALTESLLESELFGHERGAFTGAVQAKQGLLESADGGTVFLDEVGELAVSTQVKLLRVLEARQVMRVGSVKSKPIDVRFIAATNRDLEHEVQMGSFREDLFFRLNGIPLVIPPLRERVTEIEPLARALIAPACRKANRPEVDIAPDALELLKTYSWPGNIRELRNVIERALLLCGRGPIALEHLPIEKMGATLPVRAARSSLPPTANGSAPPPASAPQSVWPSPNATWPTTTSPAPRTDPRALRGTPTNPGGLGPRAFGPDADTGNELPLAPSAGLRSGVEQVERDLILRALEQCAGNQTQAAKLLGVSRRTLVSRLEQYELPRPRKGHTR